MAASVILTLWWASYLSRSPSRMATVSSTVGSPTRMGWKRRSRAASFSMCWRYSSRVVAPTHCSSPRDEHGLHHVGSVDGSLGGARADHGVQLVDEQHHVARTLDLVQHALEALLELAAVLGAGDHAAQVQRQHALAAQDLGHVDHDDLLREPVGDGGLAHAGLADEHRVVLGAPREHLDDALDLLVAADDGVELALAGQRGEIARVFLEHALAAGAGSRSPRPWPGPERERGAATSSVTPTSRSTALPGPSPSRKMPSSRCSVPTTSSPSFCASCTAMSRAALARGVM